MVKKGMIDGLSIVFLLLVIAYIGLVVIPAEQLEKVWSKQQVDFIETVLMWCTISLGILLTVYFEIRHFVTQERTSHFLTEVIPGSAQHIGAREEQQDAFGFSALHDPEAVKRYGMLAVLADGMGGFAMGKEASQLAVQTLLNEYLEKTAGESVPEALEKALHKANKAVYELALQHELEWNVGTTLVAAVIKEGMLHWISVGDSRIYLYRGGVLVPLTRDHVYANVLDMRVKEGKLTREEAESHPERHLLTSYLGIPKLDEIDASRKPFRVAAGDWILLCSDGVYDELSEPLLEVAVRMPPQQAAEFILQHVLALENPYQDNATIAILACSQR